MQSAAQFARHPFSRERSVAELRAFVIGDDADDFSELVDDALTLGIVEG